jgi:hypothetical protein
MPLALATFLFASPGLARPRAAGPAFLGDAAHLETGDFSEFSTPDVADGELLNTAGSAYDGRRSGRATYCGGGANGYARGVFSVDVRPGQDVWYGAALMLPPGFRQSLQGEVDLLRWDNFGLFGAGGDYGGVVVFGSDRRARLLRGRYSGHGTSIAGTFDLPEGRWFWLEVHQRLSTGGDARNEVFVDGRRVGASHEPNSFGRPIDRIRYGIVAIHAGQQTRNVTVYFDRASVSRRRVGQLSRGRAASVAPAQRRNGDDRGVVGRRCA